MNPQSADQPLFKKNTIRILILVSIILGLGTFMLSSYLMLNATVDIDPQASIQTVQPHILLPHRDSTDTLAVKQISQYGAQGSSPHYDVQNLKNKLYINLHPSILSWVLFYSVVLSLASVSSLLMVLLIYGFIKKNQAAIKSRQLVLFIGFFVVVLSIVAYYILYVHKQPAWIVTGAELMRYFHIIFENPDKVTKALLIPLTISALIPCIGIMLVNLVAGESFNTSSDATHTAKEVELQNTQKYKQLKGALNTFALYAGLLVSTTIIGLGLQKNMLIQQITNVEKIYPDEFIFSYGTSFTLILALFFLPSLIYLKFLRVEKKIEIEGRTGGKNWWAIGKESRDDVTLVFSILLPLFSTMVQSIIKF